MASDRVEKIIDIVQLFFLIKMAAVFIGVALFLLKIGSPSILSFLFEDAAFYTFGSLPIPVIPLLMAVGYGFVNWEYSRKNIIGVPIAVVLFVINIFNYPIGTVVSGVLLIILIFTAKPFFGIKKQVMHTMPVRAIGAVVMILGMVSIMWSVGIIDEFQRQVSGMAPFSGYSVNSLSLQDLGNMSDENGDVQVIIELTRPVGTSALEQQDVFSVAVQNIGGQIISRTTYASNTMLVNIPADAVANILLNKNIRAVYENTFFPLQLSEPSESLVIMLDDSYQLVNVEPLWGQGMTGKNVVVAVVDTGINHDMEWLMRNGSSVVIDSYELYGEYVHEHGTMCASCICSQNLTYRGTAPGCSLLNVEVFHWENGELGANLNDIVTGWDWVVQWAQEHPEYRVICSNSFGGDPWMSGADLLRNTANNMVTNNNIPMVIAAGNEGPGSSTISSPGDGKDVLSVGAVDDSLNIAYFSSRGPAIDGGKKPDVVAPGVDVHLFDPDGSLQTVSGTSFSTPTTAGVMACVVQQNKDYKASQVINAFKAGSDDLGAAGYDYDYGNGIVDGEKTLNALHNQVPEGVYTILFGVLPFVGFGIIMSPELFKKKKEGDDE